MDSLVQLFEISKKITGYPGKFFKSDRRFLMEGPLTLVPFFVVFLLLCVPFPFFLSIDKIIGFCSAGTGRSKRIKLLLFLVF